MFIVHDWLKSRLPNMGAVPPVACLCKFVITPEFKATPPVNMRTVASCMFDWGGLVARGIVPES